MFYKLPGFEQSFIQELKTYISISDYEFVRKQHEPNAKNDECVVCLDYIFDLSEQSNQPNEQIIQIEFENVVETELGMSRKLRPVICICGTY